MSNYFLSYCQLIGSAAHIENCMHACSLSDLLARIKVIWNCQQLGDNELLGEIALLNRTPINTESVNLASVWLPYRYQPKQQFVDWLIPIGHATEPFQDEYISRCRQHLFNQIIQPCSSLVFAQQQAEKIPPVQPAGFIFHLSRCGSTLISGCLSELDSTSVFSESPLLTELLLDNNLSPAEQKRYLRAFINLQSAAFPDRPQVIIKWNAWDIFRWDLIRSLYPQVPVVFLVRDPIEILASHQRLAGRHMSGDPSMASVHSVFSTDNTGHLLEGRISVLREILVAMLGVAAGENIEVIDYRQVDEGRVAGVAALFGVTLNQLGFLKIQQRMKFNAKIPDLKFQQDGEKKQQVFNTDERALIYSQLLPVYNGFLTNT